MRVHWSVSQIEMLCPVYHEMTKISRYGYDKKIHMRSLKISIIFLGAHAITEICMRHAPPRISANFPIKINAATLMQNRVEQEKEKKMPSFSFESIIFQNIKKSGRQISIEKRNTTSTQWQIGNESNSNKRSARFFARQSNMSSTWESNVSTISNF